jgi:hypothetical protein
VKLGQVARAVGNLHLFANEEMIEMTGDPGCQSRGYVQPERLLALVRGQAIDEDGGHDAGLGRGEERLAGAAGRELEDVVGREVVQEAGGVGSGQLDLAAMRDVEEGGTPYGLAVLACCVAELGGHLPAGVVYEDGPCLARHVVEWRALGHGDDPFQ